MFNWKLAELHPHQADLFNTLEDWFSHPDSEFHRGYHCGNAYHKNQVQRFYARDKADGSTWRVRTVKRLFAIRRAVIIRSKACLEAGMPSSDAWLLRNCRPAGGTWQPLGQRNGYTGAQCGSLLCPWCWMRRFDTLRRIIASPEGEEVKTHRGRTNKALGLKVLHVRRYVLHDFDAFTDRDRLKKFIQWVREDASRKGTGKGKALRLFGVVQGEGSLPQVCFITGSSWTYGTAVCHTPVGKVGTDTIEGPSVEKALRIAQPYPVHLISGQAATAVLVCRGLKGVNTFNRLTL